MRIVGKLHRILINQENERLSLKRSEGSLFSTPFPHVSQFLKPPSEKK